jgi:hypothetical protein
VGDYQPAQWLPWFRIWQPACWRGLFYALDTGAGATPQQNTFSFVATPANAAPGLTFPTLPAIPAAQPGEWCLAPQYLLDHEPAAQHPSRQHLLRFDAAHWNCATGNVQGLLSVPYARDPEVFNGHYAPQQGSLVMRRRLFGGSSMPKRLYVGRQAGGELIVRRFVGTCYALDAYAGASAQRMSFPWSASA